MSRSALNDTFPGTQLALTLTIIFTGIIVFMLLALLFAGLFFGLDLSAMQNLSDLTNPNNIQIAKFIQIFVSIGLFVIIPLFLAYLFSGNSLSYLKVRKAPPAIKLGLSLLIIFTAIPLINLIAGLNSQIKLPGFMSGIEKFLIDNEKNNDGMTEAFLKVNTLSGFALNLLMIAIIPAIGEEFLFRGILQRILINLTKNKHWGIIISGFIFSAIHMQFYGFFPRWLLGIIFGYMFVWSGSLWLPILAHFINNSVAVLAYYLVNAKMLNPKVLDFGSIVDSQPHTVIITLLITFIMTLIMAFGLNQLYKTRNKELTNDYI